jgi:flavin-dependent dehydrogenase
MYDAIVVGARCAGSPTAMLLARRGYRVLLVDRASFPSDAISTHYIHQSGAGRLHDWGLLERVRATNCPPAQKGTIDFGGLALKGCAPPTANGVAESFAPRRTILDKLLFDAAVEAGAEARERFAVDEIIFADGAVVGVRGRTSGGQSVEERARIVVGADGLHSLVARSVGATSYNERPALTCGYYSYWSGVPLEGFELYPRVGSMTIAIPTNDALTLIINMWSNARFQEFRSDIEGNFMRSLDESTPTLAERTRAGRREERFYGTADVPNFFRKPYGKGWALVGDAGYHKDPITAQGISDSFRDAQLLADALDAGLSGRSDMDDALAEYERQRNEAAMPTYEIACQRAALAPPPPEAVGLVVALQGNQADTDRFFGIDAGTVSPHEFFAPENIGRIMSAARA